MRSQTDPDEGKQLVRVYYNWVEATTEKALLIVLPGVDKPEWFPRSQIVAHSRFDNYIEIPKWLADKKKIKGKPVGEKPKPEGLSRPPDYGRKRTRTDRK